jgi:hypothetical protein
MFSTCTASILRILNVGGHSLMVRAERAKQLVEDYGFTEDDLKRFMMIIEESPFDFYAGTSIPYERKMGIAT